MSEAYNVPAPTTGDYSLKLKRARPPKPKRPVKAIQSPTPDVSTAWRCRKTEVADRSL